MGVRAWAQPWAPTRVQAPSGKLGLCSSISWSTLALSRS